MKISKSELAKLQAKLDRAFASARARQKAAIRREAALTREYGERIHVFHFWQGWQN